MEFVSSGAASTQIEGTQKRRYMLDKHGHKRTTEYTEVVHTTYYIFYMKSSLFDRELFQINRKSSSLF